MTDMLHYALAYAARGWAVFPVHTPNPDKTCSCNRDDCDRVGKHPRISHGRNRASKDEDAINRWWGMWPEANIGIATGHESGIIVLDVDDGGEDSLSGKPLPDTAEQITGSGGRHIVFSRPSDQRRYKTRVKFLPGLDSRADGGYIVAPPSLHASGSRYEWECSSDPMDGAPIEEPPEWFVDAIVSEPVESSMSEAPEWNPDGELPANIMDMLSSISAEDYDTWRDVGMALHYTDPADGLEVWDWWSGTASNYDGGAVRREWRNFSRRGHQTSNPVTLATVRRLAELHGWIDPDIEHGAEVAAALLSSHQRRIMETIKTKAIPKDAPIDPPDTLMPASGLIAELADYIVATSIRPQPRLAVAASVALLGALMGRKYTTETGLMTNVYITTLASSGYGKDHARKIISRLAIDAGVQDYMGGDDIASGQAIITSLHNKPSKLFMLDEFGKFIGSMTGNNAAPHKRDIITKLMILYSSAGSVYRGTEYANQDERPRQEIVNPNACVYGTSVPENFWGAMSSAEGGDGTLSRIIVIEAPDKRPERARPKATAPPIKLVDRLSSLAEFNPSGGNLTGKSGAGVDEKPQVVPMTDAVFSAWEDLDDEMTGHIESGPVAASIYSRVAENAAKLALIHAVSQDHTSAVIGPESFAWGRELALWSANTLMHNISRNVADSDQEGRYKRVLNIIRDSGEEGIKRRDLMRRCRFLKGRDLNELLGTMEEAEDIAKITRPNPRGRASIVYVGLAP